MSTRTKTPSLLRINSAMTQLMRHIRRIDEQQGVGRARLSALAVLHFGGPCSLTALANTEMVSRATMHHVVKGLEADGLITRQIDAQDRRRQVIVLTHQGTEVIERAHQARIDYLADLAAPLGAAELERAARTLTRLRDTAAGR